MHQTATGAFVSSGMNEQMLTTQSLSDAGHDCSELGVVRLADQNHQLLDEIRRLKAEQKVLRDREAKIMELLGTKSPDQILHDFRNVLNEKELFRVLAFRDEK